MLWRAGDVVIESEKPWWEPWFVLPAGDAAQQDMSLPRLRNHTPWISTKILRLCLALQKSHLALQSCRGGIGAPTCSWHRCCHLPGAGTYEPLDGVLRHDRSRIPALLDYVRYPHNPALQVTVLRLAAHLAERVPDLVHLLPGEGVDRTAVYTGLGMCWMPLH